MFSVKVKAYFSSAHNLRGYQGSCEMLHGHNWIVEATFKGKRLDDTGMLFDFRRARNWLNEIMGELDHKYLNDLPPFKEINPTSENLAKYIFIRLRDTLRKEQMLKIFVANITIWENERSAASYEEDK